MSAIDERNPFKTPWPTLPGHRKLGPAAWIVAGVGLLPILTIDGVRALLLGGGLLAVSAGALATVSALRAKLPVRAVVFALAAVLGVCETGASNAFGWLGPLAWVYGPSEATAQQAVRDAYLGDRLEDLRLTREAPGRYRVEARRGVFKCTGSVTFERSRRSTLLDCAAPSDPAVLESACRLGSSEACDVMAARAAHDDERRCNAGDASRCFSLARAYFRGHGVERDARRGLALLDRACDGGNADALIDRGVLRHEGDSTVARDPAGALRDFEHGCELGSGLGCRNAGIYYRDGLVGPPDPQRARARLDRACSLGDAPACAGRSRG